MIISKLSLARRLAMGTALLVLILLLVACGGENTGHKGNTTSSTSVNPARQVMPKMLTTGTATTSNASLFKTYTGTDFTIQYPLHWKVNSSNTEVAFTDPSGSYNLTIGSTPNPNGAKTADQLADGGISGAKTSLKNVQTMNIPSTTGVSGQPWSQRSITGTSTLNGQSSDIEATVLANNHPAHSIHTKGYVMVYVAAKDQFDQAQAEYFQSMLRSFKFAS